jgi:hypothetical protein
MRTTFAMIAACCAALAAAPAANAQVVAADPAAQQASALDGTLVWVSGEFGAQRLMRRTPEGEIGPVPDAPVATAYRSLDLGRDAANELTLTYFRCTTGSRCVARRDDLRGGRASLRGLVPTRCSLTTAPALWRSRVAYGLSCRTTANRSDPRRSGLYVKTGTRAARRLPSPADAVRYGADEITAVDLRGTRVAAVTADIYEYAYSMTTGGRDQHSFLSAASEGDGDARTVGLGLGAGGVVWALTDAMHAGDPNRAIVYRSAGECVEYQALVNASAEEEGYAAVDLAVDGTRLYLVAPGIGITEHAFAPQRACA